MGDNQQLCLCSTGQTPGGGGSVGDKEKDDGDADEVEASQRTALGAQA